MTDGKYAQRLIQVAHSELGCSDSIIAHAGRVSRKHINDVKHGRKGASPQLVARLEEGIVNARAKGWHNPRKHYTYEQPKAPRAVQSLEYAPMTRASPQHTQCAMCLALGKITLYRIPGRGEYRLCEQCAQRIL